MNVLDGLNCHFWVVLVLSLSATISVADAHRRLEPLVIVKKPIPMIVNQVVDSERTAFTGQRQMTADSNSGSDSNDLSDNPLDSNDYTDEEPEWIPPPPPPPPPLALLPAEDFGQFHLQSPTELVPRRRPIRGHQRRDDFTLFLVILTIAGFFGLIISMFVPFVLLLQSQMGGYGSMGGLQPSIIPATLGGMPGTVLGPGTLMGGRRRRRRSMSQHLSIMKALHQAFYNLKATLKLSSSHLTMADLRNMAKNSR